MQLFGGLKYEHRIYNEDFSSKDEFESWIGTKLDEIDSMMDSIKKYDQLNWEMIENHKLANSLEDAIDEIIEELARAKVDLEDRKTMIRE